MKDSEKIKALREALIAGEQSGEPQPFDNAAFLKGMRHKYGIDEAAVRLQAEIDKGLASSESERTIADVIVDERAKYS